MRNDLLFIDSESLSFPTVGKLYRIARDERRNLSVDQFWQFIDHQYLANCFVLQWIQTLVAHILQLAHLKKVSLRYRNKCAKQLAPVRKTETHTLSTSDKNETIATEMKDTILDFSA